MGFDCTTTDHLAYACTLNAALIDTLTTLLQGVWVVVGAMIGVGVVSAFNVFWRRTG